MDLELTTFSSRKNPRGTVMTYTWADLCKKFQEPVVTLETEADYAAMTNEEKTEAKDVGGFVGGKLAGGVRRKSALEYRTLLTLDADDADLTDVDEFKAKHPFITFLCHTTRSSTPTAPRLRWVFPLARPVTADEYPYVAKAVAAMIGEDTFDETTDQPERLMFWPSISLDQEYYYWDNTRGQRIDPDELLLDIPIEAEAEPAQISSGDHLRDDAAVDASEGRRNKTVFSFAANLRGQGLDYDAIRDMVTTYNDRYCSPPLPDFELDTICRSVCSRYAPGEAVAPTLRDAWDDFNDLGEWKETPKKQSSLSMESMYSLNARDIAPPKFVVPGMIPYGITILASPPKFGKSWMCLDLALSVATGTEFLGLETEQNGVIYLALEDGDYRLQDRSRKVAGNREMPSNMYLIKEAPILEEGLLPELEKKLNEVRGSVGLVIIDTLQKVRGTAKKTEGVYGYDYRELGALHQFALDKNLAVVLVHHLNKGGDDSDFVSRLNGSTGVSGAADTIITLTRAKRNSDETRMSITGRDVQERTLVLQMNWGTYRWICLGEERDVEEQREQIDFDTDPVVKTILWRLEEAEELLDSNSTMDTVEWRCTSAELMAECERMFGNIDVDSPTQMGLRIRKLAPQLEEKAGVDYTFARASHGRREHVFTRALV